jgi:hypothetical protein
VNELGKLQLDCDIKAQRYTVFGDEKMSFVPSIADDDGSGTKFQVHLNVSSFNGCFLNFFPRSSSVPNFPFAKD